MSLLDSFLNKNHTKIKKNEEVNKYKNNNFLLRYGIFVVTIKAYVLYGSYNKVNKQNSNACYLVT